MIQGKGHMNLVKVKVIFAIVTTKKYEWAYLSTYLSYLTYSGVFESTSSIYDIQKVLQGQVHKILLKSKTIFISDRF